MAAPLAMLTPKILIPPTGLSTALQKRIDDAADLTRIAHSKIGKSCYRGAARNAYAN